MRSSVPSMIGLRPRLASRMARSTAVGERLVPDLHREHARLRHVDRRHLVDRHLRAVGADHHRIEEIWRGAAGPQARQFGLEHRTAPCMRRLRSLKSSPCSIVAIPALIGLAARPLSRRKPACRPPPRPRSAPRRPASCTLKTIIGSPLSRASAKAAVSMTARPLRNRLLVGHVVVADGLRIPARVGRIDAVDLRALQKRVAFELQRAERRAAVGGEERIAGAAGEHDDDLSAHVPGGAPVHVGLADRRHLDRRERARLHALRATAPPPAPARS